MGGGQGENALLAACYRNSLELAREHGIRTLAFPAISTGAYGFPLESASRIAIAETVAFLSEDDLIDRVVFVCHGTPAYDCYLATLGEGEP